ncbi:MAG: hypothetical protein LIO58_09115 [Oscillospiraceae bacterium]|nr:hypothetical protein [Oscillospiraceae bacterium]
MKTKRRRCILSFLAVLEVSMTIVPVNVFAYSCEVTKVVPTTGDFVQMAAMLGGADQIVAGPMEGRFSQNSFLYECFPQLRGTASLVGNNITADTLTQDVETIVNVGGESVFGPISTVAEELEELALSDYGVGVESIVIEQFSTPDELVEMIKYIGYVLGGDASELANEFVTYYQNQMNRAADIAVVMQFMGESVPNVLYIDGEEDAYTTVGDGDPGQRDICVAYINQVGARNIGDSLLNTSEGVGELTPVQLRNYVDVPGNVVDYIIVSNPELVNPVQEDFGFANAEVLVCPKGAYLWSARSGEGALFPLWLASELYPDTGINMTDEVDEFLQRWYNYTATPEQIANILAGTIETMEENENTTTEQTNWSAVQTDVVWAEQEKANWCWAACAEMEGKAINPASTATQEEIVAYVKNPNLPDAEATGYTTAKAAKFASDFKATFDYQYTAWSWEKIYAEIKS